jgi:hypothetical protein
MLRRPIHSNNEVVVPKEEEEEEEEKNVRYPFCVPTSKLLITDI